VRYVSLDDFRQSDRKVAGTIITTCLTPFARASSPHFFQYVADSDSSPSIMVEPWEKKWTGVAARGIFGMGLIEMIKK